MVIFICKDDFDSILCGVYDAWMSRLGHGTMSDCSFREPIIWSCLQNTAMCRSPKKR